MTTTDKALPFDEYAEQEVLGSLIIDPGAIPNVVQLLDTSDFYEVKNQLIYDAIIELGAETDLITLPRLLRGTGKLTMCGGDVYLNNISVNVMTALNVEAHAKRVKNLAVRRRLIEAAQASVRLAWAENNLSSAELINNAQNELSKAIQGHSSHGEVTLGEAIDTFYTDLDEMLQTGIVPGIPTGISDFDYMVGGWKGGRLTVIGALPGNGKTTLMLNTLLHAARKGHRCLFYSLEMPEADLVESLVSNDAGVDVSPVTLLKMDVDSRNYMRTKISESLGRINKLPIHLVYAAGASPDDMIYEAKRIGQRYGKVELCAFDYIQLGRAANMAKGANREQEVSSVALGLKAAAGILDCHVLTGSQVNEQGETRESRAPTQHADTVIYLEKDESKPASSDMLFLDAKFWKNRKGKTGHVALAFNKPIARIVSVGVK